MNVVSRRSVFRKEFDARTGIRSLEQISLLRHHVAGRMGAAHSFPLKDFQDYTTGADDTGTPTNADVVIGSGDSFNKAFQLIKLYGDSSNTVPWLIRKPLVGSDRIAVGGVAQTRDVDYAIDYSTGILLFSTAPGLGVEVTAGCEFRVPCRYDGEVDELLQMSIEEFNVGDVPQIGMVEDVEPALVNDLFDYGQGQELALAVTATVDLTKRAAYVTDSTGSLRMPAVAALSFGGPYLAIVNASGSNLAVVDENDDAIGTITNGQHRQVWLMPTGGGATKTWVLI